MIGWIAAALGRLRDAYIGPREPERMTSIDEPDLGYGGWCGPVDLPKHTGTGESPRHGCRGRPADTPTLDREAGASGPTWPKVYRDD